jgi:hypothetical protein
LSVGLRVEGMTLQPEFGYFLDKTWRLSPALRKPVSHPTTPNPIGSHITPVDSTTLFGSDCRRPRCDPLCAQGRTGQDPDLAAPWSVHQVTAPMIDPTHKTVETPANSSSDRNHQSRLRL